MKIKLSVLREDSNVYSSKASDIFRQLSLAGVAIIWIFKKEAVANSSYLVNLPAELLSPLTFFVYAVAVDFLHAFIPSLIYGIRTDLEDKRKTSNDTEIEFRFAWAIPSWFFYLAKIVLMCIAYYKLFNYIFSQIHL